MALYNPDWRFVGLDVRRKRVEEADARRARDGLTNLLVWRMDARTVFANVLHENSIDVVDIFFPTPWTGSQYKDARLLLQPLFLSHVAKSLRPCGLIRIKTDVADYASRIEANLELAKLSTVQEPHSGWTQPQCTQLSRREWRCRQDHTAVYKWLIKPLPR